eukprot:scaffold22655_cov32-Tisochrysis_lutea.AAC.2
MSQPPEARCGDHCARRWWTPSAALWADPPPATCHQQAAASQAWLTSHRLCVGAAVGEAR